MWRNRSHRRIFSRLLWNGWKLPGAEAVVVGDTRFDAEAAIKAGATPVGVLCGGFPEEQLRSAGCVEIYRDPADLLARFERSLLAGVDTRHQQ